MQLIKRAVLKRVVEMSMRERSKVGVRYLLSGTAGLIGMLGLAAGPAWAGTTFDYGSYSVTNEQNVSITGTAFTPAGFDLGTFGAGQIVLHGTGVDAGINLAVWCIDAFDILLNSATDTTVNPPLTNNGTFSTGGSDPANLSTTQLGEIGGLVTYGDQNIAGTNVSAAIQEAIWEVEYGDQADFSVSTAVDGLAALYISELGGTIKDIYAVSEVVDPGSANQGLVFLTGTTSLPQTPLPATWTMMLAGLAGLAFVGYRRQKKGTAFVAA